ncbi:MAG: hypothetical protein K2X86_19130 [Cytophagaceae bacterium]|nr:hypothetical protein [Cytophagaceae bacterium]
MKTEENKKTRLWALVATGVVGVFFLGSSTLLYVDNKSLEDENKVKTEQVETLSSVKIQLEAELKSIDAELATFKGKNDELDGLLKSAYNDLNAKKKKINKLIKQNASLAKFKKEAESLKKMKNSYMTKIADMERKMNLLSDENKYLKNENERLKQDFEELNNNYMLMERKVEVASILKVDHVIVSAEKKSKNGKYSKAGAPKKTDRLLIDFELSENRVADAGDKNIYIRIIDPKGNLLPAPASEKGYFSNEDQNIEVSYSIMNTVNYSNNNIKSKAYYEVGNQELKEGEYTLEFYCEGHFCGASKYKLK